MRMLLVTAALLLSSSFAVAGNNYTAVPYEAALTTHGSRMKFHRHGGAVSFCGQCSVNADCGTCRCTGPSDGSCNECHCP
jgi:hypothetical protein